MIRPSGRHLTPGEREMASSVFGDAINFGQVRIHEAKWWPLQPKQIAMAPNGHIWLPPGGSLYRDDFSAGGPGDQGLFIHEMTHVWQAQNGGRWYLPLMRHPFCRYRYRFEPDRAFVRYGIEQQAEIVRHVFLLQQGLPVSSAPPLERLQSILPFGSLGRQDH